MSKEKSTSSKKGTVWFAILLVLFVLFVLGSIIPWSSFFTKFTAFANVNKTLSGSKIFGYSWFNNIIGAPVVMDATTGSSSGSIPAFGSWALVDVAILLLVLSLINALINKIKFNDFIEIVNKGIKKALPIAITAMLISIVLVIMVTSGVSTTIVNGIVSLTKKFNILTSVIATSFGSTLVSSLYYFASTTGTIFAHAAGTNYYTVMAFIMQSVFYLMMVIAPTSVGLVVGLYYLDIPYSKWIKYIWKAFLIILLVMILMATIMMIGSLSPLMSIKIIYTLFSLIISIIMIIGMWKLYVKAGKPGWASIVPFYNMYVLFGVAGMNGWMFLLMFVPIVNIVFLIILYINLAKVF